MTSILGISAFYHDSAAALVIDGKIIAAAQEERFTRKKHDSSYPRNAVDYVLKEANLKLSDISYIAFYEKPFLKFERLLETYLAFAPKGFKSFTMSMPIWLKDKLFQKKMLFNELKEHDKKFNDMNKVKLNYAKLGGTNLDCSPTNLRLTGNSGYLICKCSGSNNNHGIFTDF